MNFSAGAILRVLAALLMAWYSFLKLQDPSRWMFLDNVNLIFHEAGHPIFSFFGEFMMFLGGSLMQLLVPLAFTIYFWRAEQKFAACVTLFWLATSLVNLEVYIADAQAMALPLLGGDNSTHDWNWLLSTMNLLKFDKAIAGFVYASGLISAVLSVTGAAYFAQGDTVTLPWHMQRRGNPDAPIWELQNLGSKSAAMLEKIGVRTRSDLEVIGPLQAYKRLRLLGERPSHTLAYAVAGALKNMAWDELPAGLRASLRKSLNEIDTELEAQGIPRPRIGSREVSE